MNSTGFFKNKHVIIALLVAPILAIISYFAVDLVVSEKPHAAKPGSHYPLVEASNCRYSSGRCNAKNGEFKLLLTTEQTDQGVRLVITSSHPLEGILLGKAGDEPGKMQKLDHSGLEWSIPLPALEQGVDRLQLAASAHQALYYGDLSSRFLSYETSFEKDFRTAE